MGIITRHPASILHLEKKGEFQIYSRPCSCFTGVITLPHFLIVLVLLEREPRCYHIAMLVIGGVSDVA